MDVLNLNVSLKRYAFSRDIQIYEHPFSTDTHTQILTVIHCLNELRMAYPAWFRNLLSGSIIIISALKSTSITMYNCKGTIIC